MRLEHAYAMQWGPHEAAQYAGRGGEDDGSLKAATLLAFFLFVFFFVSIFRVLRFRHANR